jgi:hypothetical protein
MQLPFAVRPLLATGAAAAAGSAAAASVARCAAYVAAVDRAPPQRFGKVRTRERRTCCD